MNYRTITHTYVISYEGLNVSVPRLTFKQPKFAYANAHKKHPYKFILYI